MREHLAAPFRADASVWEFAACTRYAFSLTARRQRYGGPHVRFATALPGPRRLRGRPSRGALRAGPRARHVQREGRARGEGGRDEALRRLALRHRAQRLAALLRRPLHAQGGRDLSGELEPARQGRGWKAAHRDALCVLPGRGQARRRRGLGEVRRDRHRRRGIAPCRAQLGVRPAERQGHPEDREAFGRAEARRKARRRSPAAS